MKQSLVGRILGKIKIFVQDFVTIKTGVRPDLMRDRKRKTAFFDLEFFDQKNKAILCARILAISEQHFSI